ncbi:MAG: SDR family oxidoreductase [Maricaulaceae bacterium]
MNVKDKVVIVTGGASGIGKAMAERFHADGAEAVLVADMNTEGAQAVAASVDGVAVRCDVTKESDVQALAQTARERFGRIDLFCSNAGISARDPDIENAASAGNDLWAKAWAVNVMGHVYAARAALPDMIARGEGYFLNTVSAAGLLSQIGSAVYSTTKHAAVGFAEHLAIAHREHGIGVSILCPQAVDTPMIAGATGSQNVDGIISPEEVADAVVEALSEERFLILPHPQVMTYMQRKVGDYDRWLKGMTRLRRSIIDGEKGGRDS